MKPIKIGLKEWTLADATTGYITQFEVSTGNKGDAVETGRWISGKKFDKQCESQVCYYTIFSNLSL